MNLKTLLWMSLALALCAPKVWSDAPVFGPAPAPSSAPVTAIPLPEVSTHAESDQASLRDIESEFKSDPVTEMVDTELPTLTHEVDSRHLESSKILNAAPTVDVLRSMEREWQKLDETLDDWNRDLARKATDLDKQGQHLSILQDTWQQTLDLSKTSDTPPVVIQNIQAMVSSIKQTRMGVDKRRQAILRLQIQVGEVDARVNQALSAVKQAREQALSRLLIRDSAPLWRPEVRAPTLGALWTEALASVVTQVHGLVAYASRQIDKFFSLGVLLVALSIIVLWVRRRTSAWVKTIPDLERSARVLDAPLATACLIAVFVGQRLYPQAPRLWWGVIGIAALIPTMIILRRVLEPWLYPVLNALVLFYFLYRIRMTVAAVPILSRFLAIAEGAAGIFFVLWLSRPAAWKDLPDASRAKTWKIIRLSQWTVIGLLGIATLANLLGFVGLAYLLGNAVIRSGYLALTLYALLCFGKVFLAYLLQEGPIASLGMVRQYHAMIWHRSRWVLERFVFLFWVWTATDLLAIRSPIIDALGDILTASLTLGFMTISLDRILEFFATLAAAYWASRFIRFILEEDVYPRVGLTRGIPYAISTVIHYAVLAAGLIVAMGVLGIDMTKFTILAGAFGVGLGFGLQTILNNFFSGLILLFERPIKIGDVIETGGIMGRVQHIGIRASTVRTNSGSEVIIPNGNLISSQLTNWTFSSEQRAIELQVSAVSTADPRHVIQMIEAVAKANEQVEKSPAPRALFLKVSAGSMDFELHAWTAHVSDWLQVRSDLTMEINSAFAKENIAIH